MAVGVAAFFAFPVLGMTASGPRGAPLVQTLAAVFPAVSPMQFGSVMLIGGIFLGMTSHLICLAISQSDSRLRCPCCRRMRMNVALALATEHCDACGRPVPFERPLHGKAEPPPRPATADDPRLPSIDEFRWNLAKYHQHWVFVVALPTLVILLASLGLVVAVLASRMEPPPAPRVRLVGIEWWLAAASIVSPPLLYATVALCRWRRPQLLTCPCCRRALFQRQNVVIASRHCGRCGTRVLRDEV